MRDKFRRYITVSEVIEYVAWVRSRATLGHEGVVIPTSPDPDDDYLIALSREATTDYLVTGDAHLLEMEWDDFPPIVSPKHFLEVLEKQKDRRQP